MKLPEEEGVFEVRTSYLALRPDALLPKLMSGQTEVGRVGQVGQGKPEWVS